VELLIASVILVILFSSITVIFMGTNRSWVQGEARLQIYQNAREALNQMSRELSSAFSSTTVGPLDGSNHIPLRLDSYTYTIDGITYDKDQLTFVAAYNFNPNPGEYDLTHLGYRLDTTDTNNPKLQKYKKNFSASYDGSTLDSGCWKEMAEYIISLNFRCYYTGTPAKACTVVDSDNWYKSWCEDCLPEAVEVTVKLQDKQKRYETPMEFKNVVYLSASQ